LCFDAPLWEPDVADGTKSKSDAKFEPEPKSEPPLPLTFIKVVAWHNQPVPQREWAVLNRVPLRNVTLLSGEGGVGKSILALHLSAAHVVGRDWLGTMPEPGSAMVLCCEDDENELHYRYAQITEHYHVAFSDLKDLHPISLAGQDAVLAAPDRNGIIQPTKLFGRVREAACDIRPKLLVVDNSADVFAGNENDRAQVRQFITLLRGLAIDADTGLLLTSHPSLTGINSGTGLSGSTAWNASVRSRMYLKRATTDKDEEPDPDMRVLEVMKANYGPCGETITLRWQNGLFLPQAAMGTTAKMAAEQAADNLFLKLLDKFQAQGRNVSHQKSANAYAPAVFAKDPEAKAAGIRKPVLVEAMERLFAATRIKVEDYGRPSNPHTKLVRA
jgi:RecA-family ATPase